jgi:hypothetical protein
MRPPGPGCRPQTRARGETPGNGMEQKQAADNLSPVSHPGPVARLVDGSPPPPRGCADRPPAYPDRTNRQSRGRTTVSDNHMIGPGAHEDAATNALTDGDTETAKVLAILALASAVNRLAEAQEAIAGT